MIIGSPVYYASASAQVCAFLDRLFFSGGNDFAGMFGASVVSCRRGGASAAFDRLNKYFLISSMHAPAAFAAAHSFPVSGPGTTTELS